MDRGLHGRDTELHGRDTELGAVRELVARLAAGSAGSLFIQGPDGSGKSALLAAAAAAARSAGIGVSIVATSPAVRVPEPDGSQGEAARLIVVDDAQRLDRRDESALVGVLDGSLLCVAVLVGSRNPPAPVLARYLDTTGRGHLQLGPLDRAAADRLIESLLPAADAEVIAACRLQSGGNPRLIHELTLSVRAATAASGKPPTSADVERLVLPAARHRLALVLSELGAVAEAVAVATAVLAPSAPLDDIATLAGSGIAEAARVLDALVAAGVSTMHDDFRFRFRAPVLGRSLLAGTGAARVGLLHDRAARLLLSRGAALERVAAHLLASPPTRTPAHAIVLRQAGQLAAEHGEPERAIRLLRRALSEPAAADERPGLLLDLGRALAHVDVATAVDTLIEAVQESEPGLLRADASEELGRTLLTHAGRPSEAVLAFTRALQELPGGHPRRADIELWRLNASREASTGHRGAHQELRELVIAGVNGGVTNWAALAELALEHVMQGVGWRQAREMARQALEGGNLLDGDGTNLAAGYAAMSALMWCGDYQPALRRLDDLIRDATARGARGLEATARCARARARLAQGDVSGALDDSLRGMELEGEGFVQRRFINRAVLAGTLIERGEPRRAAHVLSVDGAEALPQGAEALFWQLAVARVACAESRWIDAGDAFAQTGALASASGCENPAVVPWRSGRASALAAADQITAARRLVAEELELVREFGGPPDALARALRVRASLGPPSAALEDLEQGRTLVESHPGSLEQLHTLLALGRARRGAGDRSGAVSALRPALALAAAGGAVAAEHAARAELSALGVRPRRTATAGVNALTPSERRVADLAAAGLTNREVGRALFVSPRTIEHHLTSIFRKLGVHGRGELVATLDREPRRESTSR